MCRLLMYKWQLRQRKSCVTQEELVKAYEGPVFDLADRYGEVSYTCAAGAFVFYFLNAELFAMFKQQTKLTLCRPCL